MESTAPITPLNADDVSAGLVLVGGTFDPPHRAHTMLADRARSAVGMADAWLVFVPAAVSPFKQGAAQGAGAHDRVAMIGAAIRHLPRATVWTDEIDRAPAENGPSYWVRTLERLRAMIGPVPCVRFIIGADQAEGFHKWREPARILELATPIVLPRTPLEESRQLQSALQDTGAWSADEIARWQGWMVEVGLLPEASTWIRQRLASGCEDRQLDGVLDPEVLAYIRRRGLYKSPCAGKGSF